MKVICIDDVWEDVPGFAPATGTPVYGHIYTVIHAWTDSDDSWYTLEEMNPNDCFGQGGFAPLSDIDEKEFERNYIKEPINQ